MRNLLVIGTVLLAAGCSMQPPTAPKVAWSYGAGAGEGPVGTYGAKPVFTRAYGLGNGDSVQSGLTAKTQYGYGAEGVSGSMVQMSPEQRQQLAAPAPAPAAMPAPTAPGTHI